MMPRSYQLAPPHAPAALDRSHSQHSPPRRGEHVRGEPLQRLACVVQHSCLGLLAVLGAEGAQLRSIAEPRAAAGLDLNRQETAASNWATTQGPLDCSRC